MSPRARRVIVILLLSLFVIGTLVKHLFNLGWDRQESIWARPQSESVQGAKDKGVYVSEFTIDPLTVSRGDQQFEFAEAWLETGYDTRHFLVWFSYTGRAEWSYLCIRTKTPRNHNKQDYSLWRAFGPESHRENTGFTQLQGRPHFHFRRAPSNVNETKITVMADPPENRGQKRLVVGTVILKRMRPANHVEVSR